MTNEEIFEIASNHLRFFKDGWRGTEWSGTPEQLLEFALVMYSHGICEGAYQQSKRYMEGVFDDD